MKKNIVYLLLAIFCFALVGRSGGNAPLSQTDWVMSTVQSGEDGAIVACSSQNQDAYPEAIVKNIHCRLEGASITICDEDTNEEWSGNYKKANGGGSDIYNVAIDGQEPGLMGIGTTKYFDGSKEGTLILSLGDYALTFTAAS